MWGIAAIVLSIVTFGLTLRMVYVLYMKFTEMERRVVILEQENENATQTIERISDAIETERIEGGEQRAALRQLRARWDRLEEDRQRWQQRALAAERELEI
jgi:uncharacterized coiled-coil protein SlyX